jgi:hypothetical protein
MLELNKEQFDEFEKIHTLYLSSPDKYQKEFNSIGADTMDIIRDWENRLCNKSESSQYGKFSSGLADKFWELIRKRFEKIDFIGYIPS